MNARSRSYPVRSIKQLYKSKAMQKNTKSEKPTIVEIGYRLDLLKCRGMSFITVRGTIDLSQSGAFERDLLALAGRLGQHIILDLSGLCFINVIGLGVIIRFGSLMNARDGRMMLHGANRQICQLIQQTQLDELFPPFETAPRTDGPATYPPLATCA